jgi:NAD(P)H-nitrite reductase large subunit
VGLKTPGSALDGVCVLRNYDQAQTIGRLASASKHAVVIGGGLVGLKAAYGLRRRGVPSVTVVVKSNHLLMRQLDPESAAMVEKELKEAGVNFLYGLNPVELVPDAGQKKVAAAALEDGREIPAGLVLVGKGVRPNTGLVSEAGGEVGSGVKVDAFLETTLPGIYAAGDCIEVTDRITGSRTPSALWTLAVEQGRYAACNIAGKKKPYPQPLTRLNSAQFGKLPFISVGAVDDGEEYLTWRDKGGAYRKLAIKEDRLTGFIMAGAIEQAGVYTSLVQAQKPLGALRQKLAHGKITAADLIS